MLFWDILEWFNNNSNKLHKCLKHSEFMWSLLMQGFAHLWILVSLNYYLKSMKVLSVDFTISHFFLFPLWVPNLFILKSVIDDKGRTYGASSDKRFQIQVNTFFYVVLFLLTSIITYTSQFFFFDKTYTIHSTFYFFICHLFYK